MDITPVLIYRLVILTQLIVYSLIIGEIEVKLEKRLNRTDKFPSRPCSNDFNCPDHAYCGDSSLCVTRKCSDQWPCPGPTECRDGECYSLKLIGECIDDRQCPANANAYCRLKTRECKAKICENKENCRVKSPFPTAPKPALTIDDITSICESCPSGFYKIPGIGNKCYGLIDRNFNKLQDAMHACADKNAELFSPMTHNEIRSVETFFAPKLGRKRYWLGYEKLKMVVRGTDIIVGGFGEIWGSVYGGAKMPKELQKAIGPFDPYKEHSEKNCLIGIGLYYAESIDEVSCSNREEQNRVLICDLAL